MINRSCQTKLNSQLCVDYKQTPASFKAKPAWHSLAVCATQLNSHVCVWHCLISLSVRSQQLWTEEHQLVHLDGLTDQFTHLEWDLCIWETLLKLLGTEVELWAVLKPTVLGLLNLLDLPRDGLRCIIHRLQVWILACFAVLNTSNKDGKHHSAVLSVVEMNNKGFNKWRRSRRWKVLSEHLFITSCYCNHYSQMLWCTLSWRWRQAGAAGDQQHWHL